MLDVMKGMSDLMFIIVEFKIVDDKNVLFFVLLMEKY